MRTVPTILHDPAGRAWLATTEPIPAFAGEGEGEGGEGGGSGDGDGNDPDAGGEGGDAGSGGEGGKPSASGKKGKDGKDGKDPALAAIAKERATLQKNLQARTEELERSRKKYDTVIAAIGGEDELEEFRTWKGKQAKSEEDRLIKEGEFDKVRASDRKIRDELETENLGLKLSILRGKIETELKSAASPAHTDAVNPDQIVQLYADQFMLDQEEGSSTHGRFVHRTEFNEAGERMSAVEFLEQERAGTGANLFKSTLKPGSGAGDGSSVEAGTVTVKMVGGALSPEEQAKYDKAIKEDRPVQINHAAA